jgi:hypothetical protein
MFEKFKSMEAWSSGRYKDGGLQSKKSSMTARKSSTAFERPQDSRKESKLLVSSCKMASPPAQKKDVTS